MNCEKHTWVFKGNKVFQNIKIGPRGTRIDTSIRALHICTVCGKVSKRTPNPNYPMPKIL